MALRYDVRARNDATTRERLHSSRKTPTGGRESYPVSPIESSPPLGVSGDDISQMMDEHPVDLLQIVESTALETSEIVARTTQIHSVVLSKSPYIDAPNFTKIHPNDLQLLFTEYDNAFFGGCVKQSLGASPLRFTLSKRMTSKGGRAACYIDRSDGSRRYEISVASSMLFGCFHDDDHRPIQCSGIVCRDRLDALQRVIEHELVHLVEILLWEETSCTQSRFHSITRRIFAHTENTHQLITPRERVIVRFGIKPGMKVRFQFEGSERTGVVNRINKRVTVLVEDQRGSRYSDGRHYAKFYVPAESLEIVE